MVVIYTHRIPYGAGSEIMRFIGHTFSLYLLGEFVDDRLQSLADSCQPIIVGQRLINIFISGCWPTIKKSKLESPNSSTDSSAHPANSVWAFSFQRLYESSL